MSTLKLKSYEHETNNIVACLGRTAVRSSFLPSFLSSFLPFFLPSFILSLSQHFANPLCYRLPGFSVSRPATSEDRLATLDPTIPLRDSTS